MQAITQNCFNERPISLRLLDRDGRRCLEDFSFDVLRLGQDIVAEIARRLNENVATVRLTHGAASIQAGLPLDVQGVAEGARIIVDRLSEPLVHDGAQRCDECDFVRFVPLRLRLLFCVRGIRTSNCIM